jgi:prepilin-type N-terminal cleavage/methylation domain-containing protein
MNKRGVSFFLKKLSFTLLELIIVLVIISILVSLAIPRYQRAAEKARASEGVRILGALREAQIRYYERWRDFAETSDFVNSNPLDIEIPFSKYFNVGDINLKHSFMGLSTYVASVKRNGVNNFLGENYVLHIREDGYICVTDSYNVGFLGVEYCPQ